MSFETFMVGYLLFIPSVDFSGEDTFFANDNFSDTKFKK